MTDEELNFKLLSSVVGDVGVDILQQFLNHKLKDAKTNLQAVLTNERHTFYHAFQKEECCECKCLRNRSKSYTFVEQWNILYVERRPHCKRHRNCSCRYDVQANVNSSTFDITLCSNLLLITRNTLNILIPEKCHIEQMRKHRNDISHNSSKRITEASFKTQFNDVAVSIIELANACSLQLGEQTKEKIRLSKIPLESHKKMHTIIPDGVKRYGFENGCLNLQTTATDAQKVIQNLNDSLAPTQQTVTHNIDQIRARLSLDEYKNRIVSDMDVKPVIEYLQTHKILSNSDTGNLNSLDGRIRQSEELIRTILSKDDTAVSAFVESLLNTGQKGIYDFIQGYAYKSKVCEIFKADTILQHPAGADVHVDITLEYRPNIYSKVLDILYEDEIDKLTRRFANLSLNVKENQPEQESETESTERVVNECRIAIDNGNIAKLQFLIDTHFKNRETKSAVNILLIAAAKGSAEVCRFLLRQRFPSDSHLINANISEMLFRHQEPVKRSPLSMAIQFKNISNVEALVSSTGDSEMEVIGQQEEQNIEAILLEELKERLASKYKDKALGVVAGFREERSIIIVYTDSLDTDVIEETEHMFCGRSYYHKNPKIIPKSRSFSSEHHGYLSVGQIEVAKQIINENANDLWSHHSNLNIITMKAVSEEDRRDGMPPCYIVLYCNSKGVILLGHKAFPKTLSTRNKKYELPVKVEEGFFEICPSYTTSNSNTFHRHLKIGCSISRTNSNTGGTLLTGTIGPFVDINGQTGFLTCAHVFFDVPTFGRLLYDIQTSPAVDVLQPEFGSFANPLADTSCGKVYKAVFDPNKEVSVDAAMVLIEDSRKPEKGRFAVNSEENYKSIGFNELPEFNSGRLVNPKDMSMARKVVKCGKTTHFTHGIVNCWGAQVRKINLSGTVNSQQHAMTNQIEIFSLKPGIFFLPGDSGSAVFQMNDDKSLECIGIAIGVTSNDSAIVTPITAILSEFGVQLKVF